MRKILTFPNGTKWLSCKCDVKKLLVPLSMKTCGSLCKLCGVERPKL